MDDDFKTELKNAILILIIVSVFALIVNTVRTPILDSLVKSGKIHITTRNKYMGANLIDDWSHGGYPGDTNPVSETNGDSTDGIPIEPIMRSIEFNEVRLMHESGDAIFFDARPPDEYEAGHITGAKPWPSDDFLAYLEVYEHRVPYDTPIVVYCDNSDCDQSHLLAQDLRASGYLLIHIFTGGYEEWIVMGQPVEKGAGGS
jgi:rhodanese-related sulfurtransferase